MLLKGFPPYKCNDLQQGNSIFEGNGSVNSLNALIKLSEVSDSLVVVLRLKDMILLCFVSHCIKYPIAIEATDKFEIITD